MLEDPDALMANPEINKIIAEGAASGDAALEVVEGQYPEQAGGSVAAGGGGEGKAARGERRKAGDNNGGKKEEKEEVVEKEATDEDPREHLNLVFIGHGKSKNYAGVMLLALVPTRLLELCCALLAATPASEECIKFSRLTLTFIYWYMYLFP